MTPDEFRMAFEEYRSAADAEANASRDSQLVGQQLHVLLKRLDEAERTLATELLCEWLLSNDEAKRWDAQSLIDDFSLIDALPTLRELAARLEVCESPGAPYEWAKVNRLIGQLASGGTTS